ncbi:MAG: universal stress protein [bacterium]
MNKIVVAIDFSECSINAFLHSLSIAEHCNGELILLWVDKASGDKDKFSDKTYRSAANVQKAFEEMIAKYQPEHPAVQMSWKIRKGKIYVEVNEEAKSVGALLIVTGTHGSSGFEEFWIGSNANKIVSASKCPVITIRGGIDIKRPLTKIILPIDTAEETRQKASFTAYIAKQHGAEVFILKLYTSKSKSIRKMVDIYANQVAEYLQQENIKFHVDEADCENISDATIEYAASKDANMIAIMTEQEIATSNIFLGPFAHQIVNHSPYPVLSIHPKDRLAAALEF